jgi:uncharacterized protein (TIGR02646 family)
MQLLEETNYRCAYCMGTLTNRSTIIEHIKPYSILTKMESTEYNNLVINCCTSNTLIKNLKSCSDNKGNKLLNKVNYLLFSDIEDHITYNLEGNIILINEEDNDLKADINTLNLNNNNLVENRYKVILQTIKMMAEKKREGKYSNVMKNKYEKYVRETKFSYPGVVIDLLKKNG